ncbi:hypothetical protein [Cryptosporangium japonicum]|uniref:Uncharacterized protein n=1 Tax=Cryptosporangium japonicum TaxID=80872 RepID=A0ABN0TFL9_9ACTN
MRSVVVRPVRKGIFRRRPAEPIGEPLTLGAPFFAVLARVPEGWTRTLDALTTDGELVFGPLEIRMTVTELSRISPYAESPEETAEFSAFRTLVGSIPEGHELVFR